jgi:membrane carboxypeptidase/penicillin-binding protein
VGGVSPKDPIVLDPAVAYQINSILSDPQARAPAFGTNSILNLPGSSVAVKTGTTNNLRDNWTFGYTSDLLVATWVGNNDNSPMSSVASGITGASPIWARTMKKLIGSNITKPFTPPNTMLKINMSCSQSPKYEYYIKGTEPKINCSKELGTLLPSAATTSQ